MPDVLLKALCATLDELLTGFIASFPDGKILHANRAAREMMAAGWPIRENNGYLLGEDRRRTEMLMNGLRQLADDCAVTGCKDAAWDICLAPMSSPMGAAIAALKPLIVPAGSANASGTVVALFITRMGQVEPGALSAIAECFDLTPAETKTLEQFMQGVSVADVARALALSENTVKTHLQNIFAKTSSSRQPQLIKLVSELRPPLRSAVAKPNRSQMSRRRPDVRRESAVSASANGHIQ